MPIPKCAAPTWETSLLLEVDNLETAYGASQVLFKINLEIKEGEAVTLLGRNGMGKTTTVRSIMGLTRARGGAISFRGRRIEREAPDRITVLVYGRPIASGLPREIRTSVEVRKAYLGERYVAR